MDLALAMIVKGDESEALLLDRCLKNLKPHVDGVFITATYKESPDEVASVERVCKKHKVNLSTFKWQYDFAAARNFNFAQVPKDFDFIMWSDADDLWRNPEKIKPTLAKHPHMDGFGFWYLYDWDESKKPTVVHKKTMIIKNDGCAAWQGRLHEDLIPNRQMETQLVDGIQRCHLSTDTERRAAAAVRNVEIAQKQVEAEPNDPRSYWNLGNSQFGVGDYERAVDTFKKFIAESGSEDEKYLAHTRLADAFRSSGKMEEAIEQLRIAIGILPLIPDAYLQLAYLYYGYGDMDKAEEYCLQGMVKRPQIHKMIVYNPRDYDYNPMMLLSKVYYNKNRPDLMLPLLEGCLKIYPDDESLKRLVKEGRTAKKELGAALTRVQDLQKIKNKEQLRKALNKLPDQVRSHPAIAVIRNTNFIKTESSGKDLVIYCGSTQQTWNPMTFEKEGVGGSEEAVIHMSRELAKLGWNVTVYNNCGHKELPVKYPIGEGEFCTVLYKPFWEFNYRDKQDVVILWRWAKPLDAEINAPKIFMDLHDVMPQGEFNEARLKRVTKIFVKTKFHRSLFPNVPDNKIEVIPNGMDLSTIRGFAKKDPMLIINTSSPERSMGVMPYLFSEVKKRVPKAKMQWAYGWDLFKVVHASDPKKMQWMRDTQKLMDEAGIETLGRLTQADVGKLYGKATIFAYPTEFAEIDCISVKKAQAAGCIPIVTDFGALAESTWGGWQVHSKKTKDTWAQPYQFHFGLEDPKAQQAWIDFCVQELKNTPQKRKEQIDYMQRRAVDFSWDIIAKRWHEVLLH